MCPADAPKRDDVLRDFPAGFTLYLQIFTPSSASATTDARDPVTGWAVRTDPYLVGHPVSGTFKCVPPKPSLPVY